MVLKVDSMSSSSLLLQRFRTEGMFGVYNRDQVVPSVLEFKYALECAMKSAMGLGFERKRETRNEHRDDCQMPLLYTKRKDDRSEIFDVCCGYGKGVKVSGVRQIYKQRPGSLRLHCRKPNATVTLHDQESAPLLQWLGSVTKQNEGKRVERAKGKEPGVSTEQSSEAREESVVVVGHRVTKDGVEYLKKAHTRA